MQSRQWVDAKDLKVGDQVTSPHGELQTLVATRYEPRPEGVAVFNFQVEGYHTYYVREHGTRGPPVLVHNADSYHKWKSIDGETGGKLAQMLKRGELDEVTFNQMMEATKVDPEDIAEIRRRAGRTNKGGSKRYQTGKDALKQESGVKGVQDGIRSGEIQDQIVNSAQKSEDAVKHAQKRIDNMEDAIREFGDEFDD